MTQAGTHIPTVETGRLVLRGPARGDFDAYAEMLAGARTHYMGGPFDRGRAWGEFSKLVANWHFHGFGGWVVTERKTGAFLGEIGVMSPGHYPEPELGWTLTQAAEGHGYAFEGATAALEWWWRTSDTGTVVSYVSPGNARSEALALRLGAALDPDAPLPEGETRAETKVFRHRRPASVERLQ